MIGRFSTFFEGTVTFCTPLPAHIPADLLFRYGISAIKQERRADGFYFVVPAGLRKKTETVFSFYDVPCKVIGEWGLPSVFKRLILRPGLIVGFFAALLALYGAMQFVWSIKVTGNDRLLYGDVIAILKEEGFEIGSRHSNFDFHKLCNEIPLKHPEIAWISVNMMGAVAEVEVYEYQDAPPPILDERRLVNLVAGREGRIVSYRLSSGLAMVSVGETVEPGQLLVAGYSVGETGLHPKTAVGEVYAEVSVYKEVFIPFSYIEKQYTEEILLEKSVNILEKSLKFLKNTGFSGTEYDTIEEEYSPSVFGIALPLLINERYAHCYVMKNCTRNAEEAMLLAKQELNAQLDALGGQLSSNEYFFYPTDEGVRAVVQAQCILNIAQQAEVELP